MTQAHGGVQQPQPDITSPHAAMDIARTLAGIGLGLGPQTAGIWLQLSENVAPTLVGAWRARVVDVFLFFCVLVVIITHAGDDDACML